MSNRLMGEARALIPFMEDIFYTMHRNPELGRQEFASAELVCRKLKELGIEYTTMVGTGVVGVLRGGKSGRTIGFRADMDALPVQEETGLEYASQNPGVMHACGHDFHTAALLGTAAILAQHREELAGNVKFFFQPDEEDEGGAAPMIAAGCMEQPHVDAMLCMHVDSMLPSGTMATRPGPICAATNPFTVTIRGRGTHGAKPHLGDDVIVAAAQIITALQTVSSRRAAPTEPVVVTLGSIHSGAAGNVLPSEAVLKGTLRTFGSASRKMVTQSVTSIVTAVAAAMGVEATVDMVEGYCACVNDNDFTESFKASAVKVLGDEHVVHYQDPSMGADDFGYFSDMVPGCYFFMGVGSEEKGFTYPIHNPRFAADLDALPAAAALQAQAVLDYLKD